LVTNGAAEPSFEKCLDQLPRQRGPDHFSTQTKNIHVVVFNALVGGEHIVDESSSRARNFVRCNGCAHSASAERHPAFHLPGCDGPGERNHEVGEVVSGVQFVSAEIHDLMAGTAQQLSYLALQRKAAVV
jgi:hypothetical protein